MSFNYAQFNGPNLEKLFRTWHEILGWYEDETEDFPYWYLERTNIGHLALAVYQRDGIAVQEFSCLKGKEAEDSSGRADLYMKVPMGRGKSRPVELNIEAKQQWCSVAFNANSKAALATYLSRAEKDCRNLKDKAWRADLGAGIVFLLPYSKSVPTDRKDIRKQLKQFTVAVSKESKKLGASFAAFHYPALDNLLEISKNFSEHGWCPGITVIGKFVK